MFGGRSGGDDDDDAAAAAAATAAHLVLHVEAQPPPLAAVLLSRGTADASAQETEERGRVARYGLLRAGLISHWSAATAAAPIVRAEATRRVTQVPMGAALEGAEAPPPSGAPSWAGTRLQGLEYSVLVEAGLMSHLSTDTGGNGGKAANELGFALGEVSPRAAG